MDKVYAVILDKTHSHPVVAVCANLAAAEREVARIVAEMPGASHDRWVRYGPTGRTGWVRFGGTKATPIAVWDARRSGPSTRGVAYIIVAEMEVVGSGVIDKLAELVQMPPMEKPLVTPEMAGLVPPEDDT